MTNESYSYLGVMLTKSNIADIDQYMLMIKTSTGKELSYNEAVRDLIEIGADAFIREY